MMHLLMVDDKPVAIFPTVEKALAYFRASRLGGNMLIVAIPVDPTPAIDSPGDPARDEWEY